MSFRSGLWLPLVLAPLEYRDLRFFLFVLAQLVDLMNLGRHQVFRSKRLVVIRSDQRLQIVIAAPEGDGALTLADNPIVGLSRVLCLAESDLAIATGARGLGRLEGLPEMGVFAGRQELRLGKLSLLLIVESRHGCLLIAVYEGRVPSILARDVVGMGAGARVPPRRENRWRALNARGRFFKKDSESSVRIVDHQVDSLFAAVERGDRATTLLTATALESQLSSRLHFEVVVDVSQTLQRQRIQISRIASTLENRFRLGPFLQSDNSSLWADHAVSILELHRFSAFGLTLAPLVFCLDYIQEGTELALCILLSLEFFCLFVDQSYEVFLQLLSLNGFHTIVVISEYRFSVDSIIEVNVVDQTGLLEA